MNTLLTTLKNASRPAAMPVVARKVLNRLGQNDRRRRRAEATAWCTARAENVADFAEARDPALWREACAFAEADGERAARVLAGLGVSLGGGAHGALLYFLVRLRQPETVLETGVAAGFSSQALLAALERNGAGTLYSSDFPYVRLDHPERYVGAVVEDRLKHRWQLHIRGDRHNLGRILPTCGPIGLLHYDSDKSPAGRAFVMERVDAQLAPDAVVVMDDIQGNTFFRDHVERHGIQAHVFGLGRRFLGLIERRPGR